MLQTLKSPGLARRFAFAAAGLAAGAVLVVSVASWWLIKDQHQYALQQLNTKETQFHAAAISSDLNAVASRMDEVAGSTILATGLVDSAGRETYLTPYLEGIRQINGIPLQLLFTDFEGNEISSNSVADFGADELQWLQQHIGNETPDAKIFLTATGPALVSYEPLTYARTQSPEGALLYKVMIADLHTPAPMQLEWGPHDKAYDAAGQPVIAVEAPDGFEDVGFRVRGPLPSHSLYAGLEPRYVPIFFIVLTLFGAVVLVGLRLSKVLTRDLKHLEAFSGKFLSSGQGTARMPVQGNDEVASLARSINEMLDRLDAQHAALVYDQEKLQELADALQVADRRKDDFLATLAHELRNPLAPIKNSITIMGLLPTTNPRMETARDIIARQVDHMSRLLDDLLDVSRITRNKLELRVQTVELSQVLTAATETSRPLIDAAGHELRMTQPDEPIHLRADPVRLAQVFANLLNNAAKFTPQGGRIEVTVQRNGDQVMVSVKDNGAGIRAQQMPHIFDMFIQSESSLQRGESGLGIGLSLVRGLVSMHGGSVDAKSAGHGHGSEFVVRLNAELPAGSAASDAQAPNVQAAGSSKRILVADDNRDAADSLAVMLSLWGHEVKTAHDGRIAVEMADKLRPDVVLLDIGMPHVDGYEAAQQIRSEPWGKAMLLIALTGWGQATDKQAAQSAGFDHHLVKPADPETLRALLDAQEAVRATN